MAFRMRSVEDAHTNRCLSKGYSKEPSIADLSFIEDINITDLYSAKNISDDNVTTDVCNCVSHSLSETCALQSVNVRESKHTSRTRYTLVGYQLR